MSLLLGTAFGFAIGVTCGWLKMVPPAPLTFGPVIVLAAITAGYLLAYTK